MQPGLANPYEQYSGSPAVSGIGSASQQPRLNPYATDASALGGQGSYYTSNSQFSATPQYHLYVPMGPYRENLLAYQRTAHDFFISDELREDLQRKSDAAQQILPNSALPQVDYFHSLVPLDKSNQKNPMTFGYPSWIYKTMSGRDGQMYALRRIEGYRLTDEKAIRSVQAWKRIDNGCVVTIHDAFTTRVFGDSSLIFVTDYHPESKTLAEQHFAFPTRFHGNRGNTAHVPEQTLWGYVVQIAQALKAIHSNGLAARLIKPSKILLTGKNRIRLNACAVLDVTQFDSPTPLMELQQDDLIQFGETILSIAINSPHGIANPTKAIEQLSRSYSERLREAVTWLLTPQASLTPQSPTGGSGVTSAKDIDGFLLGITSQMTTVLDSAFHAEDTLLSALSGELENARLVRLMAKLGFVNERPEFDASASGTSVGGVNPPRPAPQHPASGWSETGERYYAKLFRDYVFHQVDQMGNPVVDLAHVLNCLNKLDAGSEERIQLTSRDEQSVLLVSYRDIKRALEGSFLELTKSGRR
jgi:PAB-dependent poly(A)-specific ribonuclease subunit 3